MDLYIKWNKGILAGTYRECYASEVMTLSKIRYFLEVARCLNFTRAAERLFMAQPNLSKHIAQMEEEIGVQLFVRTKRSVNLTQAGQLLFERLDGVDKKIEDSFEEARAIERGESGRISIGILEGQDMKADLLNKLQRFEEQYPHVEVLLERSSFSKLRNGLSSGHYDAIITLCFDVENEAEFESRILLRQGGGVIAINRKNELANKKDLTLWDLRNENFVVISPEESPRGFQLFFEECGSYGFTPKVTRRLSSLESLMLCVETGCGIALLDHNTRLEKNSDVCLITIPESPFADLGIAWRKENTKPVIESLVRSMQME